MKVTLRPTMLLPPVRTARSPAADLQRPNFLLIALADRPELFCFKAEEAGGLVTPPSPGTDPGLAVEPPPPCFFLEAHGLSLWIRRLILARPSREWYLLTQQITRDVFLAVIQCTKQQRGHRPLWTGDSASSLFPAPPPCPVGLTLQKGSFGVSMSFFFCTTLQTLKGPTQEVLCAAPGQMFFRLSEFSSHLLLSHLKPLNGIKPHSF